MVTGLFKRELESKRPLWTHGGVVGQVWRDGARQVRLAKLLSGTIVVPVDEMLGRRTGILLGRAKKADIVDAAIVLLAEDGDQIVTSDPDDLRALADAAGLHVEIVEV